MNTYSDPFTGVVTVIDSLRAGGAERLVVTVLKTLAQETGTEPLVLTLYPGGLFEKDARDAGVRVICLGDRPTSSTSLLLLRLRSILRKQRPRLVHGHLFPVNYLLCAASIGLRCRPKFVFTEHNVHNRRRDHWPFRLTDRLVYSRFSKVICVSEEVRASLVAWLPQVADRAVVLRNCIPISPLHSKLPDEREWDFVAVGSLTPQKAHHRLIEAIGALRDAGCHLTLAIAGDGPLRRSLEASIQDRGLSRQVSLLGTVQDIDALLANGRAFAMASDFEGHPLALLEAMAAGLPVIVPAVGGLPEIVVDSVNGLLVEPGSVKALTKAMETIQSKPDLALSLGHNARAWVEKEVSVVRYMEALATLYQEVTPKGPDS